MSTWNYRVVKKNGYLGIHEAYCDDGGNVHSLSSEPVPVVSDDFDQLRTNLNLMAEAFEKGMIDFEKIPPTPNNI